jgi:retinol-binding protein 3
MKSLILSIFFLLLSCMRIKAQLSKKEKTQTIDSVTNLLEKYYVFPQVAKGLGVYLQNQLKNKAYDTISSGQVFAEMVSAQMKQIGNDRHLRLTYSADVLTPQSNNIMDLSPEEQKRHEQWLLQENYGIASLKVLPGNIGYIDFNMFCDPQYAGETYVAAMNYVAHTDALIIDLRNCRGAISTEVIPFLSSYFFNKPTHLNDFYWREGNQTIQAWTQAVVPGKKYINKPVYILTSSRTFSGAEEFAYNFKNLKRATIIGEVTSGGANGGSVIRVNDHFTMFVPLGRAINPITKTNWEGVGVMPDTLLKSTQALHKAQTMALEYLLSKFKDDKNWKSYLLNEIEQVKKTAPVFSRQTFALTGFENAKEVYVAGSFNHWSQKSDKLQRKGNTWITDVEAEPGRHTYKFVVDGRWVLDPSNFEKIKEGEYENSVIIIK